MGSSCTQGGTGASPTKEMGASPNKEMGESPNKEMGESPILLAFIGDLFILGAWG